MRGFAELEFLAGKQPAAEENVTWGEGAFVLRVAAYRTPEMPPPRLVTSVRALLFCNDSILVIRDAEESFHILPGGRREDGEKIEETLEREVLEETGWSFQDPRLRGLLHYHHLGPRPPAYPYPYPDFVQLVFVAEAGHFFGVSRVDPEILASDFHSIDEIGRLCLPGTQLALFHAALEERSR